MLVLRLGEVHKDDCETLSTTTDWLPIDDFADESLAGMELRCCPSCIDGQAGRISVADLPDSEDENARAAGRAALTVPGQ